jgi:hypothetical protein
MEKFKMYVPEAGELFGFPAPPPITNNGIDVSSEGVVKLDWRWVVGLTLLALGAFVIIANQQNKIQQLNEIVFSPEDTKPKS